MIEENGIKMEKSNIKITDLGLDARVINRLKWCFEVETLEDLLEIDYEKLFHIRGLGEESILKLKECVHKLGYSLKNEKLTINEVKEEYRKQGKTLLEELGLATDVCVKLYRNNIYTLDELVQYGDIVYDLDKFGNACCNKLKVFLEENNCVLKSKKENLFDNIESLSEVKLTYLGLDTRVINKLKWCFEVETLEDLLEIDYEDLLYIKGLGEENLLRLKECVHKHGFVLKNEKLTMIEIKENYRKQGKLLLEELGLASDVCVKLYRNNIYTLEELVQYGDAVYDLDKLGAACCNKLKAFLKANDTNFSKREYSYGDIETLGLSTKVEKLLLKNGISNIYQLREYSYGEFKSFENLGEKKLTEILGVMRSFGIRFCDEIKDDEENVFDISDVSNDKNTIDESLIEILKNQIQLLEFLKKEKEKLIEEYKMVLEKQDELLREGTLLDQQILSLGGDKSGLCRKRNKDAEGNNK